MAYKSIDELQTLLSQEVFGDRQDSKKAAGRALGTFIETIVLYLLRQWGLNDSIAIERPLAEYGREEITHNVEFTLHPVCNTYPPVLLLSNEPTTAKKIVKKIPDLGTCGLNLTNNKVIDNEAVNNACIIGTNDEIFAIATPDSITTNGIRLHANILSRHAYAMIECKRVGKEGDAKGPQTIEKAKQGAYVAKTTSSLQKVRDDNGRLTGIYYTDGKAHVGPYQEMLREIIANNHSDQLRDFTLSIGVVSNHGNWFTAESQNKEMKVLAQSYDWLLFLTDEGLAQFITDLLCKPKTIYKAVREAFLSSYPSVNSFKPVNSFTKKHMNIAAHLALDKYFTNNKKSIEKWFNIISPDKGSLEDLRQIIAKLRDKDWRNIL